jgi:hypothetical protein
MAMISIDCMNCRTTNQIDSSLAVVEGGVLKFNCTCTHCGSRLVSVRPPEAMGFHPESSLRKKGKEE